MVEIIFSRSYFHKPFKRIRIIQSGMDDAQESLDCSFSCGGKR